MRMSSLRRGRFQAPFLTLNIAVRILGLDLEAAVSAFIAECVGAVCVISGQINPMTAQNSKYEPTFVVTINLLQNGDWSLSGGALGLGILEATASTHASLLRTVLVVILCFAYARASEQNNSQLQEVFFVD
jgi:hypothetical protein